MTPHAPRQLARCRPSPNRGERAPTPEPAAAIETRDRDVFPEAGAGTGKTRVLVERYCDAVTEDGIGPESDPRLHLHREGGGRASPTASAQLAGAPRRRRAGDPERASELARAARDTERAWIGTIHGFCRRLLAAHPVAAGLDPRFRVLDEAEAERLAEHAFDAALEEVVAGGGGGRARVRRGLQPRRLRG